MKKYADYLISVKKEKNGFVWRIWNKMIGGEVLECSLDAEDDDDKYFPSKEMAYQNAAENIQYHYT